MHLARVHGVRGPHGRFSMRIVHRFFPLLNRRRWAEADRFLKELEEKKAGDEWIKGYVHALKGMVIALKVSGSSPHPYVLEVKDYGMDKLQEAHEEFLKFIEKPLNTSFDEGYFQAWIDHVRHLLLRQNQLKKKRKNAH